MRWIWEPMDERGQALSEMVLSLPLICLLAAGTIQFSALFISYIQFEHACGESARQYAAGLVGKNNLEPILWENLGSYRPYFDRPSLTSSVQPPRSQAAGALDQVRRTMGFIPGTLQYDGAEWKIKIRFHPPFFFRVLFPRGLWFESVFQVYRYPR